MAKIPQPPIDSRIQVQDSLQGFEISLKNPEDNLVRRFLVSGLFRIAWLVGWTIGGAVAIKMLFTQYEELPIFVKFFISAWLMGWFFGEIAGIRNVIALFWPVKPERIILGMNSIAHHPGSSWKGREMLEQGEDPQKVKAMYKKVQVSKSEVGTIQLESIDEEQVLSMEFGADKVVIGSFLEEKDRKWLYEVLKDWKEN